MTKCPRSNAAAVAGFKREDAMAAYPFQSFLMAGFECSSHRRFDGRRVDMVAATRHDEFALRDYERLSEVGISTARDGLRWYLIESSPRRYDFASVAAQLDAAQSVGIQVIWDLFHYGYPDGLAGETIPLGARIVAVCDAFDAMITSRPYRAAMSVEQALEELRACSGTQFDPVVVTAFCEEIASLPYRYGPQSASALS